MVTHKVVSGNKEGDSTNINVESEAPIACPFCHMGMEPKFISHSTEGPISQVFMKCSLCKNSFIGKYENRGNIHYFKEFYEYKTPEPKKEFSKEIMKISKNFTLIYSESEIAEEKKLTQICGAGYRKAFEFLIKDYLIGKLDSKAPDYGQKKKAIIDKFLGDCISEDIENPRIKEMAQRAAWLGNDETHYTKKWDGKDLSDLKKLIEIVTHFIDMEAISVSYLEDMQKS